MTSKNKPVILVDSREKHPWDWETDDAFEGIKHIKLDAGDYSIEGLEHIIAIERKATVDELFVNFTKDKERIIAEFDRLKNHKVKVLIIEETCEDVLNPMKYYINKKGINTRSPQMPTVVVMNGLNDLILGHGVLVIFGGSKAQKMARGLLLRAYELHQKGLL